MPHSHFLGFDIFPKRRQGDGSMFSRTVGYYAERCVKRSERLEARTLRELKTLIRGVVAARRTGIIR